MHVGGYPVLLAEGWKQVPRNELLVLQGTNDE
jgi:hypothetical protein